MKVQSHQNPNGIAKKEKSHMFHRLGTLMKQNNV